MKHLIDLSRPKTTPPFTPSNPSTIPKRKAALIGPLANAGAITLLAGAMFAGIMPVPAQAATKIWDGGDSDADWTSNKNWDGSGQGKAPVANDILTFSGSTRPATNNGFTANTQFNGLIFASGAAAFTLGGNAITLGGDVTNNSSNLQTINLGLVTTAVRTFTTNASGNMTVSRAISGTGGGVLKAGSGTLTLTGTNSYTGATTVSAGTLALSAASLTNNIASSSGIGIGNGATLNVSALSGGGIALAAGQNITGTGSTGTVTGLIKLAGGNHLGSTGTLTTGNITVGGTGNQISSGTVKLGGSGTGNIAVGANADLTVLGNVIGNAAVSGNASILDIGSSGTHGSISGTVEVGDGGTLEGTGSVGALAIAAGGTLSTGNSPGTTTVTGTSLQIAGTFNVDLGGKTDPLRAQNGAGAGIDYDAVHLTNTGLNTIDLTGAVLTLNGTFTNPFGHSASFSSPYAPGGDNTDFDNLFLIINDGTGAITGSFANTDTSRFGSLLIDGRQIETIVLGGQEFAISYTGDFETGRTFGGNDLVLTAVPEPSTWWLIAAGGAGMLGLVRRQRRHQGGNPA